MALFRAQPGPAGFRWPRNLHVTLRAVNVTFLGTGTSVGAPVIGCSCPVCTSGDPRNRRLRPSAWLRDGEVSLLLDTATDLREQALAQRIDRVDAVLYTHAHADHILGLDELRIYNWYQKETIPVYGAAETLGNVRRTFWYAFERDSVGGSAPRLETVEVDGPFRVKGLEVVPVPMMHASLEVLGYRIGPFAYCTDVSLIPPSSLALLEGLDVLVLTALRHKPHPGHFTVEQALEIVRDLRPARTYFTHMTHDLDYETLERETPDNVHPAYDGLTLQI